MDTTLQANDDRRLIWWQFGISAIFQVAFWTVKNNLVEVNPILLQAGLAVLVVNFILAAILRNKITILGHLLGSFSLFVQILIVILIVKSI